MTVKTTDQLVSPVTASELADWVGVDSADTLLPPLLLSATDAVIRFLGYDLNPRQWTLTLWDWPAVGARTWPNLVPAPYYLAREINLPYGAVQSVSLVEVYGQATALYTVREDSLVVEQGVPYERYKDNTDPALVVTYTAGLEPITPSITDAIKMLAGFLFEHRGACDVMDGLTRSGAAMLLQPYKRDAVVF